MAMQGDAATLQRDGFVVVRNCVALADLDATRATWEALLDRQREVWAREAPLGKSAWDVGAQPRLGLPELVAATQRDPEPVAQMPECAQAVAFCLGASTLGVSAKLMPSLQSGQGEAGLHQISMMCSPVADHGPSTWHRVRLHT